MKKIISTILSFVIMLGLISTVTAPAVFGAEFKYAINVGADKYGSGGKWGFIKKPITKTAKTK